MLPTFEKIFLIRIPQSYRAGSHGRRKKRRTEAMRQLAQADSAAAATPSSSSIGGSNGGNNSNGSSLSNLTVPSSNKKARNSISELGMSGSSSFLDTNNTPDREGGLHHHPGGIGSPDIGRTPSNNPVKGINANMITSPLASNN